MNKNNKQLEMLPGDDSRECQWWLRERVARRLPHAKKCDEIECPRCGSRRGYSILKDPKDGLERMWFCREERCLELDRQYAVFKPIYGFGKTADENKESVVMKKTKRKWGDFD